MKYNALYQKLETISMEYQEFVDGINKGTIQKVSFSVQGYAHYRNYVIESKCMINSNGVNIGRIISVHLTPDGSERKGFLDDIDEKTKLFHIKGKGTFTLKQMWDRITINSIE